MQVTITEQAMEEIKKLSIPQDHGLRIDGELTGG